ncbi:hypothetical protein M231_03420 [Tremella mesenterica]|uniref:Uncharacterized protein n=1 Tax=Tremella mesenterica TaxID=5217 RepID=A0A4Q1BNA9_TREME|nr:hypothetical protein M231_03420 [Tremella mesenterica]
MFFTPPISTNFQRELTIRTGTLRQQNRNYRRCQRQTLDEAEATVDALIEIVETEDLEEGCSMSLIFTSRKSLEVLMKGANRSSTSDKTRSRPIDPFIRYIRTIVSRIVISHISLETLVKGSLIPDLRRETF